MTSDQRLEICKKCPLYKETSSGPVCDSNKYINSEDKISYFPRKGYVRGCNCKLFYKTKDAFSHCVIKKW